MREVEGMCSRESDIGDAWNRLLALEVADDVEAWDEEAEGEEEEQEDALTAMDGAEATPSSFFPSFSSSSLSSTSMSMSMSSSSLGRCSNPGCVTDVGRAPETPLQRCGRCGLARYCGRACQVEHWRAGHRRGCLSVAQREARVREELAARGQGDGGDGLDVAGALWLTRGRVKRARMLLTLALTGLDLQLAASLGGGEGTLGRFLEGALGVRRGVCAADLARLVPAAAREAREQQELELARGQREAAARARGLVEDDLTPVHAYVLALCRRSPFFREYGDVRRLEVFFARIEGQTETAFGEAADREEARMRLEALEAHLDEGCGGTALPTGDSLRAAAEEAAEGGMMGIRELRLAVPAYLAVVDECVRAAPFQLRAEFSSVRAASRKAWTQFARINEGMEDGADVDEALVNDLIESERSVRLARVRKNLAQGIHESSFDVDTWRERDIDGFS